LDQENRKLLAAARQHEENQVHSSKWRKRL